MSEARQPAAHRPEDQASSVETEVMRLLESALNNYEEIMELADLEDDLNAKATHPVDYSWDNPMGLVVRGRRQGLLV